jgi:photosystem II stability/assembly factor-like uncharacterized protein
MKQRILLFALLIMSQLSLFAQTTTITSFTPESGAIGSSVSISGTNFNTTAAQNIVFFGATQAIVAAASATSLTVTVPLGATYQYLSVTNLATGLTAYSAKPFVVTLDGSVTFSSRVDFTTGSVPFSVNIGDIDGDGKPDLVLANKTSNNVSVLLNTSTSGNVSFAAKVDFATGLAPYSVSIGDIDGDGKPDLAVPNNNSNTVSVLRNTSTPGSVSFATNVDFATDIKPRSVSIGDIDGDGKPDLAVATYNNSIVSVFRNTSTTGSLSFDSRVDFTTGTYPCSVSIGDIDGDGKVDLATANYAGYSVSVLRNTSSSGSVSFATNVDFTTGSTPQSVSIGDIDGDGKADLAVANMTDNTVSVLRNNSSTGNVSFATKIDYATGIYPYSVNLGDVDGDGKVDLAVANYSDYTVSVLRSTCSSGNLSFDSKADFPTGSNPVSVSIGDIDGDGKPDLAVANMMDYTVSVIRQIIAPPTITSFTPESGTIGSSVTITGTNFNATTAQNIVFFGATQAVVTAASATSLTVTVPLGATYQYLSVTNLATGLTAYSLKPFVVTLAGSVSFATKADFTTGSAPQAISIGDVDGDGKADLAVVNSSSSTVSVLLNTSSSGSVSFATKADFATGTSPRSLSIGDIDGDGKADLAVANYGNHRVSVFLNTSISGSVSFAAKVNFTTGTNPRSVSIGDIDGDGKVDLAVANYTSNTVSVFRNTSISGSLNFDTKLDFATGVRPYSVSIGDIDGDGKADLAVANYTSNTVSVLRNTSTSGSVSFATKADFTTGLSACSVNIGDIDGDGKVDLAVANMIDHNVSVLHNTSSSGNLNFDPKTDFTPGNSPRWISTGDIDGDGKLDLTVANYSSNTVSVLRQIPAPPTITSFTPTSAETGATVTITGSNFTEATAVSFGITAATSYIVVSGSSITAVVGSGTTGSVSVTTPYGTANSTGTFTYLAIPVVTTQAVSSITDTTASGNGTIVSQTENANERGCILYDYTNSDKVTGDAGVVVFGETGSYPTGAFSETMTLYGNTHYNVRAYAKSTDGPGYGARVDFYSLAKTPVAPTVDSPTLTTLQVTSNTDGNSMATEYAIFETTSSLYVQAGGTLSSTIYWSPNNTFTVTGLTTGTTYTFQVKAKNTNSIETAYGPSASGVAALPPTINWSISNFSWVESQPAGDVDKSWCSLALSKDGTTMIAAINSYQQWAFRSDNSGTSWNGIAPAPVSYWGYGAMTPNDTILLMDNGDGIYRSVKTAGSWGSFTKISSTTADYGFSASADGMNMLSTNRTADVQRSVNSGSSWNSVLSGGDERYASAISSNGTYMLVARQGSISRSINHGVNWSTVTPAPAISGNWKIVAMSASGARAITGRQDNRLFISNDYGASWSETQPAGNVNYGWKDAAMSGDGNVILAGSSTRMFLSMDGGTSWSETRPRGDVNFSWDEVAVSHDGTKMMAAGNNLSSIRRLYTSVPVYVTPGSTTATSGGTVTNTNSSPITAWGAILYPYTDTDKIIGGADVTNYSGSPYPSGTAGNFSVSFTGLTPDTHYNTRAYATNGAGTMYCTRVGFWTVAAIPDSPTVGNPTTTTLDLTINVNGNPSTTVFCIQDSVNGTYVQANGTRAVTAVWQTATAWGTKTITGLTTAMTYYYKVKARNADSVETAYSASASGMPVAAPSVEWQSTGGGGGNWLETQPAGASNKSWQSVAVSEDGMKMLASVQNGRLYKSTDGGTSWSEAQPAGAVDKNWSSVSVSGDGQKMLASVFSGRLYMSTDGGTSWSETQPAGASDKNWSSVSVSGDGQKMVAGAYSGRVYVSTDGGTSWSDTQPAGNNNNVWQCVCISGDGQTMLAGVLNGRLYTSANGGTSWSETQPVGNANANWKTVSVSGNGQIMLACVYLGRLYKSTNGGTSWSEAQPAGNADNHWMSVSVSGNGQVMLACANNGRLYKSTNGGTSWSETQPAGNANANWTCVSVSGNGMKMLAGVSEGRLYSYTSSTIIFNPITATTASATANITATNGANAGNRGAIMYEYSDTDKIIGDAGVTNVSNDGSFGTGTYTFTLSSLTPNTRYNARAHATNTFGTGYSVRTDFRTLANVPDSPTVNNPTATSLDVAVNVNSNPTATEFAIQDSVNGTYVQINGTLAADTVWQTATAWGTKPVTGLSTGVTYYFRVKARNGNNTETAFSFSTGQNTCSNPTNAGEIDGEQTICYNTEAAELGSVTEASDYGGTLEYQWQSNTTSSTFTFDDIIGASSNTYSPGARTQTSWFRRLARVSCKDDWTGAAVSNVIKVTVDPATISGSISGNDSTIVHTTTGDLTLSGQTGEVLQWEKKLNTGDWEIIPGTAITTYSDTPLTVGEWYYRALVQSGVCSSTYTSDYMVEVIPDVPEHFTLSSPGTATAGYASENFVISVFDQYDNPTYCRANTTFTLTTNSTSGSNSFNPASPKEMGVNTYTSTFTYTENRLGTFVITAIGASGSPGLTGESRSANITIQILPWQKASIGVSSGNTDFFPENNAGTFKQTAQGVSAPKSDVMNFEYQSLCGNGTIIARLSDVASGGWAGVMMRESNAPGAKTVLFKTKLYNPNVWIGVRSTTNGNISNTNQIVPSIRWMKIQRTSSNTFKVYTSYDGTTWIRRYTATVAMNNCINAGFFAENIVAGRTTTAWFDHAELATYLKETEAENEIISKDQFEVMVYPNPAEDRVTISIPENTDKVKVTLISSAGLVVETSEFNSMEVEYYINHIKPGMYLLRFERDGIIVNKRLVVL